MIPTVGRIVHYTSPRDGQKDPFAALIIEVGPWRGGSLPPKSEENNYCVSLHIFDTHGPFDRSGMPWSDQPAAGCWSWPPRA